MSLEAEPEFAVIIAAGGSGTRFSGESLAPYHDDKQEERLHLGTPIRAKQFLTLKGLPLYAWSLLACSQHHLISSIILVTPSPLVSALENESRILAGEHKVRQTIEVIAGGTTRQASVFQGLQKLSDRTNPPEYVLIHDAARPFLDFRTVDNVIKKAIEYGACSVGSPVSDTIKRVVADKIVETIPREELVAVQTPQAGKFSYLMRAHEKAQLVGYATTDDAAILEWAGHDVFIVPGPANNLKITQPLDLILAEALGDYLFKDRL